MTREKAIEMVGEINVAAADAANCEPSSRAYDHEAGEIEWYGTVEINEAALTDAQRAALPVAERSYLTAIYYTTADDSDRVGENGGDWGMLDWTVHHYSIG